MIVSNPVLAIVCLGLQGTVSLGEPESHITYVWYVAKWCLPVSVVYSFWS